MNANFLSLYAHVNIQDVLSTVPNADILDANIPIAIVMPNSNKVLDDATHKIKKYLPCKVHNYTKREKNCSKISRGITETKMLSSSIRCRIRKYIKYVENYCIYYFVRF